MAALLTCWYFPDTTVGELAKVLALTGSGAVRLVDRLEQDGLVRRLPSRGRQVVVRLSERGRRLAKRLQCGRLQVIDEVLSVLSAEERRQLGSLLEAVLLRAPLDAERARQTCRFCDHGRCDGERCPVGRSVRARGERTVRAASLGGPA